MNNVIFAAILIFGCLGIIAFVVECFSIATALIKKYFFQKPVGQIVITRDISDGQNYMQLEIYKDKQEEFFNSKKVTLDVIKVDYASDAGHIMEKSK